MNQLVPFNKRGSSMMLKKPVPHITIDEAEAIKRAVDVVYERSHHTKNDLWIRDRDRLLLQMMWTTGARISDVLSIQDSYLEFQNRTVTFLVKKRKDKDAKNHEFWHTICVDMETLTELMAYIHTWSIVGYLFKPHMMSKKPLTRQAVAVKIDKLVEIAGISRKIHAHMYRHGLARHMQGQGAPAELIAYQLAHSSTQVTLETYARLDALQARNMCENIGVKLRR